MIPNLIGGSTSIVILLLVKCSLCADLVIEIPGNLGGNTGGYYRLDYRPPEGFPRPNTTIPSGDVVGDVIQFSKGLPGTKYEFRLYYSNETFKDWLTWTASITTAPDPPSNLSVNVRGGKQALVSWQPPSLGHFSSFKLKVIPISDPQSGTQSIEIAEGVQQYSLRELTPGATYQVQAYTQYEGKDSVAYSSRNFTTKPNTPGKFIVWFRNETTLLVLWQPPYPAGVYTHYKVSIEPPDALESILYVQKEEEPPGPAQAAFKGLVPGRAYNISVQTMSEDEISAPTTAQYRTVPLRPLNITFDKNSITSHSFKVMWEAPKGISEFDKYQLSLASLRRVQPVTRNREDHNSWEFRDHLEPGHNYQVVVKTVSGKVTSWPATGEVTLKPLPVQDLRTDTNDRTGIISISWSAQNTSKQDNFKISYHEVETYNGDSNTILSNNTSVMLESLLPGRNYSITVQAVSKDMESNETVLYIATRPSSPIIEDLRPIKNGLNISWKSDVNSRQENYEIMYRRNDTNDVHKQISTDSNLVIRDLHPGAGYEVRVFAISHGLKSEPHDYFQAVYPNPPLNMSVEKVASNSVLVHWTEPEDSTFSEYAIRYRTESDKQWVRLSAVKVTEAEITDMTPGEKYTIQVNTVSYGVESSNPQQANHTVRPNQIENITPLIDSNNITLAFPRPEGRIEYYVISWWPSEDPKQIQKKNISESSLMAMYSTGSSIMTERLFGNSHSGIQNPLGSSTSNSSLSIQSDNFDENKPVRILIGDLKPGVEYSFEIYTTSYGLNSDKTQLVNRTMPLIQSELVVINDQVSRDSLTLRYTPTPQQSSRFDAYRFALGTELIQEKSADDEERRVKFTGLTPGKLYDITVWTVSSGVLSQPLKRQDRIYPEPITGINATKISANEITLQWDTPKGEYDVFEVQYLNADSSLLQNITDKESITIDNLKPYRNYTFTVVVRSGNHSTVLRSSLPVSASFRTLESIPERVERFAPTDIRPNEVAFEWYLAEQDRNGVLKRFTITYGEENNQDPSSINRTDFDPQDTQGVIRDLVPGKTYVFRIRAETRVGYGPDSIWKLQMPILAPPQPNSQVVPTEVCKSSTTIRIRFRKNYFSEKNGAITSYTIIVAEDDTKNSSGLEMLSWRDVQGLRVWLPYQAVDPYYPFKNASVEDFTIGTEDCESKKKTSGYCNGPLKAGATYSVKVRAFTARDKFTDTHYSFRIQTDQDNTPIIVGVTVPLICILLLLVTVILLRRRRNANRKATEARHSDAMSLPDSVADTTRPVRIENFAEHYRIMSADSDFRFSEEFEELKHVGREQPCTFADLPCNRPKNRFTNILPYDHSRFKLQPVDDEEGSDYINANYVPGHNSPREFIVTQGPLHSTRDDFWRMCWESNSRAIVMLTRCVEKGREKCDHYWPCDTLPAYYGDICVTILNDSHYLDWSVTEFMMTRGETQRVMKHFHFTTWPDFGVPSPPQTLVRFARAFRERVGPEQRPVVVHCSAGVGRSGTFIALDRILQQIRVNDYVDIFGIVWQMRKERVWMVQTEQQYICIHQCLLAVLEGRDNTGPPREIYENQGFEDDEGIAESGM